MTLADHLTELGLTQAQFRRLIQHLAGKTHDRYRISLWARGKVDPPPTVLALAGVLTHIKRLDPVLIEDWLANQHPDKRGDARS